MKLLVSACLMGCNCKYSGGNNRNEKVVQFAEGKEIFQVCPEVMGGLSIPRVPCEIVNGKVINGNGFSCDDEYHLGARLALEIAQCEHIDLAVLKARSPSCGVHQIYDGTFSGTLQNGQGVFARLMTEHGYHVIDEEDLENLI